MTRRIPAALGLVIVLVGAHQLAQVAPMFAMMMRDAGSLPWIIWLLVGGAAMQLGAGIAIAIGWRHARLVLLAWTLFAVFTFIFARDLLGLDATGGTTVVFIELLAGPAIAWLVPLFVGDTAPEPRIPRAHLISTGAHPGDGIPEHDLVARRFDLGVVLLGLGITWIASTVLSRTLTFIMIARSADGAGALLAELIFLAHALAVGIFAIVAAQRLLDPTVEPAYAQSAFRMFVIVDIAGNLLRTALFVGYQLVAGDFGNDIMRMLMTQWILGAAIGLVIPLFLWWYARPALVARPDGPPALPSPSRLAAVPAWAMLWFAPLLLSRLFVPSLLQTDEVSSSVMHAAAIACAIQGAIHLVAAIATFLAQRENTASEQASRLVRIARIAAIVGLVNAIGLIAVWILVMFGLDAMTRIRQQAPVGPLVNLVASAAAMWWALRQRRR